MGNKEALEIIPAKAAEELDQLKGQILEYDAGVRRAFGTQMGYAFLAGLALARAKTIVPHGNKGLGFSKWRESNLPQIPQTTASCYMRFADKLQEAHPAVGKLATVASFKSEQLQLPDGELPEPEKQEVLKAVHDAADGKSLTQMYRDLGVIRQPKDPNAQPKKTPVKLTPEEKMQAILKANRDAHELLRSQIRCFLLRYENLPVAEGVTPPVEFDDTLNVLLEATAFCRRRKKVERCNRKKKSKSKTAK